MGRLVSPSTDAYSRCALRGENRRLPAGRRTVSFSRGDVLATSAWERAGGRLDESPLAADLLWARFHRSGAKPTASRSAWPSPAWQCEVAELAGLHRRGARVLFRYGGTPTVPGVPLLRRPSSRSAPGIRRRGAPALAGLPGPPPARDRLRVVHDGPGQGWRIEAARRRCRQQTGARCTWTLPRSYQQIVGDIIPQLGSTTAERPLALTRSARTSLNANAAKRQLIKESVAGGEAGGAACTASAAEDFFVREVAAVNSFAQLCTFG
jgi:hypothetical protein